MNSMQQSLSEYEVYDGDLHMTAGYTKGSPVGSAADAGKKLASKQGPELLVCTLYTLPQIFYLRYLVGAVSHLITMTSADLHLQL